MRICDKWNKLRHYKIITFSLFSCLSTRTSSWKIRDDGKVKCDKMEKSSLLMENMSKRGKVSFTYVTYGEKK